MGPCFSQNTAKGDHYLLQAIPIGSCICNETAYWVSLGHVIDGFGDAIVAPSRIWEEEITLGRWAERGVLECDAYIHGSGD